MGIVDYLSREPNRDPWPESELDERFVVTSIENFHKALDCLSSRFIETDQKIDVNILEYSDSGIRSKINHSKDNSSHGCCDDRFVQNWTKLDRNENGQSSRFQSEQNEKNTLNKISRIKQSDKNSNKKDCNKISNQSAISRRMEKNQSGSGKSKKITTRQNEERRDELTEQVTETTFSRTRMVKRGACSRQDSDTSDSDLPQVQWRILKRSIKPKGHKEITSANSAETNLISFWDLMGAEKSNNPKNLLELEARTVLEDRNRREQDWEKNVQKEKPPIIEVDLTAESPSESPEDSVIKKETITHKSRKDDPCQVETSRENSLDNLTKLFDRSLLAELISEDAGMHRLRRVIERNDRHSFELMGPYTNPLWHQLSVVDDCILVDNKLAVPGQLRQAVLKRIYRGHPGHEAMLDVSKYLCWPHMHKDIVNLAEECRSCTRYGKNAKYIIPKNASKPFPLLSQPGQEFQLDYAGPLEEYKGKKYICW